MTSLTDLPSEILLLEVFVRLRLQDLLNISLVCKRWNESIFWVKLLKTMFNRDASLEDAKREFIIHCKSINEQIDWDLWNQNREEIKPTETWRIVLLGDHLVGKSSLLHHFNKNEWDPKIHPTIGVDFDNRLINLPKNEPEEEPLCIKLQIWDTAGRERFRPRISAYYRCSYGALLCFDITSESSFKRIDYWLKEILENNSLENFSIVLVGLKLDEEKNRQISREMAFEWASSHGMRYFESSTKTNINVHLPFASLAYDIHNKRKLTSKDKEEEIQPQPIIPEPTGFQRLMGSLFSWFSAKQN
eukprot:TRINITY_DN2437_c0_g1_i15.p1 TRINITY_DN2437_c0_g1~~TRINITY_DN2437_c0_g1_i15.p1  ORF type:complete len:303 (+),score=43.27 TRINITY_DN2437_c0_g1_i15:66-974(+)